MQQTNKRYLFQKWSCQTSWYLFRAISVKGISIKGSWSQFHLIFCCCCCLNSAINSPTYPPHSFSEAYKTLLLLVQGKFNTPVTARNRKARYWRNRDCFHLGLRIRQPCTLMTKRWWRSQLEQVFFWKRLKMQSLVDAKKLWNRAAGYVGLSESNILREVDGKVKYRVHKFTSKATPRPVIIKSVLAQHQNWSNGTE